MRPRRPGRGSGSFFVNSSWLLALNVKTKKVPDPNGTVVTQLISGASLAKFTSQLVSWLLHELVAVAAAFEDAWLKPAWAVGNFAGRDLLEHQQ